MAASVMTMPAPLDLPYHPTTTKGRRGSKKSTVDEDGSKAGKRGRPRVDPQDQNAAERRRTQIRLAQRAYRERKETTIAELESKVQQLQSSLQQVCDAVRDFQSLAATAGVQSWNASVAVALQEAVDKTLEAAGETGSSPILQVEARPNSPKRVKFGHKRAHSPEPIPQGQKIDETIHHREDWLSTGSPHRPQRPAPWGYQWTYENDSVTEVDRSLPTVDETCSTWLEAQPIAALPDHLVEPPVAIFTQEWMPTIGKELHPYNSFTFPETSWARRFHRYCYEHTYALLTNPAAPPELIHEKLRYSLCFGSVRMIAERIKWKLMQSTDEPMEMWDLPVLHLGGAGHNFPRDGIDDTVPPPQGFSVDYNMGPFPRRGQTTPPARVYPYQVAQWLGIEGVWFDGYDVEQYLRSKGLALDGWSALATIEVDEAGIPVSGDAGLISPNGASTLPDSGPQSPMAFEEVEANFFPPVFDSVLAEVAADTSLDFDASMELDDPITAAVASPKFEAEVASIMDPSPMINLDEQHGFGLAKRRQVTIDIERLMREFYRRSTCIGRSPGIKQDQVDEALHSVIQEALNMF